MEIDNRFKFLHEGMVVIDCGASPGSWSQVAVERVNAARADKDKPHGLVISVDIQTIDPLPGAVILDKCDITQNITIQRIEQVLQERKVDVVLSDMAPSATGVRSLDHEQIVQLAMAVLKLSCRFLRETTDSSIPSHSESGGSLLLKLWQGKDVDVVLRSMQKCFHEVRILKPVASRSNSAEIYLFAQHFTLTKTVPVHAPS